ncbi:MAG TPA: hypothetical protein DFR83_04465, partial [Deltaproteobacteria bacterium]|nr:hypothetical protein [Deltaproteobacteria bacterium]
RAGLQVLAPGRDHPALGPLDAHLHALDPVLSETLFLPAYVDPQTGLPALSWMDRVRAEQLASQQTRLVDLHRIDAIRNADPVLARRLAGRRQVVAWLEGRIISQEFGVVAELVRRGEGRRAAGHRVRITLDRRIPRAGWTRLRVDVDARSDRASDIFQRIEGASVVLQEGFVALLSRHVVSPLPGVHSILNGLGALSVHRLSRGTIGPFWFPGGPLPEDVPEWAKGSLVLHLGLEVIGREVRTRTHHDPFTRSLQAPNESIGTYRGRRLAVSPHSVEAVEAWCRSATGVAEVVPLVP